MRSGSSEVGVDMGKIWQNVKICKKEKMTKAVSIAERECMIEKV